MSLRGSSKKINNSYNYVIQKSSIVIIPNIDLINICFKIDKIFFCKYLEIVSNMIFNINLRKLPSQYGEVSVMYNEVEVYLLSTIMMVTAPLMSNRSENKVLQPWILNTS